MMASTLSSLFLALLLGSSALAYPSPSPAANSQTSYTLLYQNNLNASDDADHVGAILLDPMSSTDGARACSDIGESLISRATLQKHDADFFHSLAYLEYSGTSRAGQKYYIQDGTVAVNEWTSSLTFPPEGYSAGNHKGQQLPILCTQSSRQDSLTYSGAPSADISVTASRNTYVGTRNLKSFRFLGIPYANQPQRFEYSQLYSATGQTIQATSYGPDCAQTSDTGSSENCLFLNIQTPYIPAPGSKARLRPVLFSIHGGGFTGGSGGPNSGLDSGNLASRDDVVGVEINYRLSTLGFLAIPGTDIKGNFGIGDQVTALRWVRQNIAQFGGDPDKITIIGESAGAGSVRALLGSPPVINENLIVGAVAQSNLGGGETLGLTGNYGTTYSSYYSINQSYAVAGQQIFHEAGCNQTTLSAQISCLKAVPAQQLVSLSTVARYVVQDGYYVNTPELLVSTRNSSTAHIPVIFGTTANDGASFSTYPPHPVTSEQEGIELALGISPAYAQAIISSGLFPFYSTGNLTLDAFNVSQRVATDTTFRCIDEATVYAGALSKAFERAYYYTMQRTYAGYDPNNLGASGLASGPVSPGYPSGDPEKPYFRLHGSDLGFTYGTQAPLRDAEDLAASRLISGYFSNFARTGDPNFDLEYLRVRGYWDVLKSAEESGPWLPVTSNKGPSKSLDAVSRTVEFPELEQCAWLNYSISYYLE